MDKNDKQVTHFALGAVFLAIAAVLAPFSLGSDGPMRAVLIVLQVALVAGAGALLGASVARMKHGGAR